MPRQNKVRNLTRNASGVKFTPITLSSLNLFHSIWFFSALRKQQRAITLIDSQIMPQTSSGLVMIVLK